jgi:hypothetical protein
MRLVVLAALIALLPALGAAACSQGPSARPTLPSRDLLMLAEIEEARDRGVPDLYELLAEKRPRWLRPAFSSGSRRSSPLATVWMDNRRLGGISELRNITLASVESVRYLSASDAQIRLGLDNPGGAILVTSRRP